MRTITKSIMTVCAPLLVDARHTKFAVASASPGVAAWILEKYNGADISRYSFLPLVFPNAMTDVANGAFADIHLTVQLLFAKLKSEDPESSAAWGLNHKSITEKSYEIVLAMIEAATSAYYNNISVLSELLITDFNNIKELPDTVYYVLNRLSGGSIVRDSALRDVLITPARTADRSMWGVLFKMGVVQHWQADNAYPESKIVFCEVREVDVSRESS